MLHLHRPESQCQIGHEITEDDDEDIPVVDTHGVPGCQGHQALLEGQADAQQEAEGDKYDHRDIIAEQRGQHAVTRHLLDIGRPFSLEGLTHAIARVEKEDDDGQLCHTHEE